MVDPRAHDARAERDRANPRPAAGLLLIGAGLVALALLGPLVTGAIDYRVAETLRNQTIGLDAVSLVVVAPLSLLAALLALRDRAAGRVLALGIGAYSSSLLLQYVLGPDHASLTGDDERLFPLCLVLFAAGRIVGLVRGRPCAHKALCTVTGSFALVGPTVAAMGIAMQANDDPDASTGTTVFMTVLGAAFATFGLFVLWPLLLRAVE